MTMASAPCLVYYIIFQTFIPWPQTKLLTPFSSGPGSGVVENQQKIVPGKFEAGYRKQVET